MLSCADSVHKHQHKQAQHVRAASAAVTTGPGVAYLMAPVLTGALQQIILGEEDSS